MIKQYRKNKLISELEFDYESLKLLQQAKEDLIIEKTLKIYVPIMKTIKSTILTPAR